ncbi:MAG: hypothetical protein OXF57_04925, partial [Rhodospirillaceae bacterium]|nr:hypothetical protein [Rhodospirillaceae bacterium]
MDANLAGLVALGALIIGLFAWLRQDIRTLRDEVRNEISGLRGEMNELRDRVARIEGLLEAVFMRRDLTPLPDPPSPGGP